MQRLIWPPWFYKLGNRYLYSEENFKTATWKSKTPIQLKSTYPSPFSVILLEYLPIAAAGYFIFGDQFIHKDTDNILSLLNQGGLTTAVTALITIHLTLGFVIVINPFCQELEELFKIPLGKFTLLFARFTDTFYCTFRYFSWKYYAVLLRHL